MRITHVVLIYTGSGAKIIRDFLSPTTKTDFDTGNIVDIFRWFLKFEAKTA